MVLINYVIYFLILAVCFSVILALMIHFDIQAQIYITYILWLGALCIFYFILPSDSYHMLNFKKN